MLLSDDKADHLMHFSKDFYSFWMRRRPLFNSTQSRYKYFIKWWGGTEEFPSCCFFRASFRAVVSLFLLLSILTFFLNFSLVLVSFWNEFDLYFWKCLVSLLVMSLILSFLYEIWLKYGKNELLKWDLCIIVFWNWCSIVVDFKWK